MFGPSFFTGSLISASSAAGDGGGSAAPLRGGGDRAVGHQHSALRFAVLLGVGWNFLYIGERPSSPERARRPSAREGNDLIISS
jgi:hypothetical protein